MSQIANQKYLLGDQYQDASKFNARAQLHIRFRVNTYGWFPWVFDHLHLPPQCRVLELGCGPANLWVENIDRIPEGWDITLSDFSAGILGEAQQNLGPNQQRFSFAIADAQAIPFPNEDFDAIIANHMLYHVPDRVQAFAEIRRILRPSGRFYASTTGAGHLQELAALVRRFDPDTGFWGGHPSDFFNLERGLIELPQSFASVVLHRYEDALVVTEAEPLVAYILSGTSLTDDRRTAFTRFVEDELQSHGAMRITIDCGIFEAFQS